MAKKQFKAESKRLLDLMINSIYTNREIFLRELISNASDAQDKLYYNAAKAGNSGIIRDELTIDLTIDKENRTITIADKGIGMTNEEMESNLGTIAKSGSLDFKSNNEAKEDVEIIGQFGVGFYSAFMIAKEVTVVSKVSGSDTAYKWNSTGAEGYTMEECEKETSGTTITLTLKDSTEDDDFDEFLDVYKLTSIVKKYSDYIRYPITLECEHSHKKEDSDEYETYTSRDTLNSMVPIWKKNKNEITSEDYSEFYKSKFFDFEEPCKVIHTASEGLATYNALLFIPQNVPMNFYTREFEKGLQLYANGVLIMDKCADLLPDHFSFVRGIVDSQDLSLNISREMLQQDRQLKVIAKALEKKIKNELALLLKNDREKYEKFFASFGLQLKYGIYSSYGMQKDLLQDLLMFHSSSEKKMVTLEEYVSRMKEEQKDIYYICGESFSKLDMLPQTELLRDKGYEILYMKDDVDEFLVKALMSYKEKNFKNASDSDLNIESDEEKELIKTKEETSKDMLTFVLESLEGKVANVKITSRLKSHPVCLSSQGELSLEMEKILSNMPGADENMKAQRVLEINAEHDVFKKLNELYVSDKDKLKSYAEILYTQGLLIEGLPIEDPVSYTNAICNLMI